MQQDKKKNKMEKQVKEKENRKKIIYKGDGRED